MSKRQRQRDEEENRCALRPVPDNRAKPRCSVLIEASVANIDKLPLVESKICLVFAKEEQSPILHLPKDCRQGLCETFCYRSTRFLHEAEHHQKLYSNSPVLRQNWGVSKL